MRGDVRGRRIAVVADGLVNPAPGGVDHLLALERDGWGVIALCPPGLAAEVAAGWREAILDQVVTFLDDEYEVAVVTPGDEETAEFVRALASRGRAVTREMAPPGPA
jgi:hypothetical protein